MTAVLNRSALRHTVLMAALITCLPAVLTAAEPKTDRPNILFLFADDWGRYAGIYSKEDGRPGINDVISTPNFDAVAKRGVLFRNAHVNAPSCTPCRSSLLSGQYFWRTGRGAILQGAVWDSSIPAWPLLLKESGYHIGKSYKVWSPGTPADAPFGGQQFSYQKAGGRVNQFSQTVTSMVAKGTELEDAKQSVLNEVRRNFQMFLEDRESESPFAFWYGPTNVHRKWIKGSGKKLWNIEPDDLKGKMPPFLPDVPEVREDLADYLGEAQAFDAAIGVFLEELKKANLYDNTLIVISGDHGAPGFPHGKCNLYDFGTSVALAIAGPGVPGNRVVDDFVNLPDLAPTFLESAGVEIPSVMTARSLWPTLSSSESGLVDRNRTWVVTGRERHVEMARAGYLPYPQRALRTNDYLYIINFKPDRNPMGDPYNLGSNTPPTVEELTESTFVTFPDEDAGPTKAWLVTNRDDPMWKQIYSMAYGKRPREELYDLRKDPHQVVNVAADPAYEQTRQRLNNQLMEVLTSTRDPRTIDDGAFFETPPMAGELPDDVPHPNRKRKKK
ncbi:MAG: sulfatase [Planctomycetaceae bacterium]